MYSHYLFISDYTWSNDYVLMMIYNPYYPFPRLAHQRYTHYDPRVLVSR